MLNSLFEYIWDDVSFVNSNHVLNDDIVNGLTYLYRVMWSPKFFSEAKKKKFFDTPFSMIPYSHPKIKELQKLKKNPSSIRNVIFLRYDDCILTTLHPAYPLAIEQIKNYGPKKYVYSKPDYDCPTKYLDDMKKDYYETDYGLVSVSSLAKKTNQPVIKY